MKERRRSWQVPKREATPEEWLLTRRRFMETVAVGSLLAVAAPAQRALAGAVSTGRATAPTGQRTDFGLDRALTDERTAATCSPYVELTPDRDAARFTETHAPVPCRIEIGGLVKRPLVLDHDALHRLAPIEERVYRLRCVEGWAAVVPWLGVPLAAVVEAARPLDSARFVRFESHPPVAPQAGGGHLRPPSPYSEGLTLAEATNELAFLATGIYGHDLPLHHGAPLRLVVPWKYAHKSIKAVTRIEFTATQPATFWNSIAPDEYPFHGNVDPHTPHPRWSQRREKMLGTGEVRETLPFNGYAEWVANLYV